MATDQDLFFSCLCTRCTTSSRTVTDTAIVHGNKKGRPFLVAANRQGLGEDVLRDPSDLCGGSISAETMIVGRDVDFGDADWAGFVCSATQAQGSEQA